MWCDTDDPELEPEYCVACGIDPPCADCAPIEEQTDERYFVTACGAGVCGHGDDDVACARSSNPRRTVD